MEYKKVLDLITKRESSSYKKGGELVRRTRVGRRYIYYSKIRYNFYVYKVVIRNRDNINTPK